MDETTKKWQYLDIQMILHDATSVVECRGCHQHLEQPKIIKKKTFSVIKLPVSEKLMLDAY